MGLADAQPLYKDTQTQLHLLGLQAGIDFSVPLSKQSSQVLAKLERVAVEEIEYLCAARFPTFWPVKRFLAVYINNRRSYPNGKANPKSAVAKRHVHDTKIGRKEEDARLAAERRLCKDRLIGNISDVENDQPDSDAMDQDKPEGGEFLPDTGLDFADMKLDNNRMEFEFNEAPVAGGSRFAGSMDDDEPNELDSDDDRERSPDSDVPSGEDDEMEYGDG